MLFYSSFAATKEVIFWKIIAKIYTNGSNVFFWIAWWDNNLGNYATNSKKNIIRDEE